jgi:hypothetical protein
MQQKHKSNHWARSVEERAELQTVTKIDENTVIIENEFGKKAISMDRLIEITWPGDHSLAEVVRNIDDEIGGAN